MSNQNTHDGKKIDVQLIFDSDNSKKENNDDVDIKKEIELSLQMDQAENKRLPKEIIINGVKFTNISVRDVGRQLLDQDNKLSKQAVNKTKQEQDENNIKQIEERMRLDQEENKKLPTKAVIGGHEFTNIKVRDIPIEPRNERQIHPEPKPKPPPPDISKMSPRGRSNRSKDSNKTKHPIKLTVTLKDIGLEGLDEPYPSSKSSIKHNREELPKLNNTKKHSNTQVLSHKNGELPILTNHKHASIQASIQKVQEQKSTPRKKQEHISTYDPSIFYAPIYPQSPVRAPRQFNDPIELTVTLKDIGLDGLDSPIIQNKRRSRK